MSTPGVTDELLASAWCYREPLRMPTSASGEPWEPDCDEARCRQAGCRKVMAIGKRHHCRRCGLLFCERHTSWRSTVPGHGQSMRTCFGCAIDDFAPNPLTGGPPIRSPPAVPVPIPPTDALEFDVTLRMHKARMVVRDIKMMHVQCAWGGLAAPDGAGAGAAGPAALIWRTPSARAATNGGDGSHPPRGGAHVRAGGKLVNCATVRWGSARHFGAAIRQAELARRELVFSVRADGLWFLPSSEIGSVRLSLLQLATGPPNYNIPILGARFYSVGGLLC